MKIIKKQNPDLERLVMCAGKDKKGSGGGLHSIWFDGEYLVTTDTKRLFATKNLTPNDALGFGVTQNQSYDLDAYAQTETLVPIENQGPHYAWRSILERPPAQLWKYHARVRVPEFVSRLDKTPEKERPVTALTAQESRDGSVVVSWLINEPEPDEYSYAVKVDLGLFAPFAGAMVNLYLPKRLTGGDGFLAPVLISPDQLTDTVFKLRSVLLIMGINHTQTPSPAIFADLVDQGGKTMSFGFNA